MGKITPLPRDKIKFKYKPRFGLIVLCASEGDQAQLYKRLRKLGLRCRVVAV